MKAQKNKDNLVNFAKKYLQERILIIILKVKENNAILKIAEELTVVIRNLKVGKWDLPKKHVG